MKPFPGQFLPETRRIFNYRLSRARMVVENTFGILAARWRIYHSVIIADEKLINQIVEVTVILHNFLRERNDTNGITEDSVSNQSVQLGSWRDVVDDNVLGNITRQGSPNYSQNAAAAIILWNIL
jgi:hypothetical protein